MLNAAGIAAPVLWLAAFLYNQTLRPDYSPYHQYISELAARGTSTQHLMQVTGFVLPGLLIVAFGLLVGLSSRTRLAGAVLTWCVAGGDTFRTRAHWFRWYSLGTFIVALSIPMLLIRMGTDPANVGLFQRASFGVLNLWILVFAVLVWFRLHTLSRRHRDCLVLIPSGRP